MSKNIILCSDGTGNSAIKGRGTNVFKIYEAVDTQRHSQIAFYDDGVGTESFKLLKVLGGAFGYGLSRNVRQLYAELARVYRPEDKIYLFGFSRGAFTVRTLAGFIADCGILDASQCKNDAELHARVRGAYKAYRRKYPTTLVAVWDALFRWRTKQRYGFATTTEFKSHHAHEQGKVSIHFIGVWDTVSAVGFPIMGVSNFINSFIYHFKFSDHKLSRSVKHACHALAIDDKRRTFHPEMWDEEDESGNRIEQVWFAGVHANVGGGYNKQGISLVALDWMMKKARTVGMHFVTCDADSYTAHQNVNDKLYDSRSGIAVYYRYAPRDLVAISQQYHLKTLSVHESVLQRTLDMTEGYAPGNIARDFKFVSSDRTGYVHEEKSTLISEAMGSDSGLLSRVKFWIELRKFLHAVFLFLSAIFVYLFIKEYSFSDLLGLGNDPAGVGVWVTILRFLLNTVWLLIPLLIVFWLSRKARRRMQNVFSAFWYSVRNKLS